MPNVLLSQDGMDYSGPPIQRYSSLRQAGGLLNQLLNNEKALAVYKRQALPSSQLEINSTDAYTPFLHPNLGGDRGLVFRTVAPAGFTQQWEMYRDNNLRMGRLFNLNGTDDFIVEASENELVFNTGGANERYRIREFGSFQWFSSNATGLRSMALGNNTTASGENSFSGGVNSTATADHSFSFGFNNQSTSAGAVTFGQNNIASGQDALSVGLGNQSTGDYSFSFGTGNEASGRGSFAFGPQFTQASGRGSFAGGFDVFSTNIGAFAFGENIQVSGAFATGFGQAIQAPGNNSLAFGVFSQSNGSNSVAIGTRVRANDEGSFVLGYSDTTTGWFLENNIQNSLMVGFDSDISTLFVGQSSGLGTTGNVGIGELTAMGGQPQNKLEITSDGNSPTPSGVRLTNLTSTATANVNPGNGVLSVDANGDVIYVETSVSDDQNLTNAVLNGTILTVDIEDGNPVSVDLANLQDGTGTDNQNLTNATLNGSILTIDIENGNSVSVDLSGLVSSAQILANNGLSLDPNDPNQVQLGQVAGDPNDPAELIDNREIPMNNHNLVFTNDAATNYGNNQIGIGTSATQAKLHISLDQNITTNANTVGTRVENFSSSDGGTGFYAEVNGHSTTNFGFESFIDESGNLTSQNQGFRTTIRGGDISRGLFVNVSNAETSNIGASIQVSSTNSGANTTTGVRSFAYDGINRNAGGDFRALSTVGQSNNNYGVYALTDDDATNNYAVYGQVSGGGGNSFAGYFNGDVVVQGDVTANAFNIPSDSKFKENINNLTNSMSLINSLEPKVFNYDTTGYSQFGFESDQQMGLIAQDVEQVIPAIVSDKTEPAQYDTAGVMTSPEVSYKGVEYEELIPLMVAGMQEQNTRIDSLENELAARDSLLNDVNDRLTQLENCLGNLLPMLCQINNSAIEQNDEKTQEALINEINVELFDGENIILEQNIPNPFAERTVINYSIPESVREAKLMFYNNEGRMMREVSINERGAGKVNVFGADLSKGTYSYTLVCDGEVIATKTMVKQ